MWWCFPGRCDDAFWWAHDLLHKPTHHWWYLRHRCHLWASSSYLVPVSVSQHEARCFTTRKRRLGKVMLSQAWVCSQGKGRQHPMRHWIGHMVAHPQDLHTLPPPPPVNGTWIPYPSYWHLAVITVDLFNLVHLRTYVCPPAPLVLTYSRGHRNTNGWQKGGMRPTGILYCTGCYLVGRKHISRNFIFLN